MHNSNETWENLKTAGRYAQQGVDSFCGKGYESKMLASSDEFIGPYSDDFIPLKDSDLIGGFSDRPIPQPKLIPGQNGIPTLAEFYAPPDSLRSVFYPVHFNTDEHTVRQKEEIQALLHLTDYLKQHHNVSIVVEGNCDERASASYNMALGMRRAHYVRSFLVQHGVDLNRIFTVSKGKENPLAIGHTPEDWTVNRRCEFRIWEKIR